MYSAYWRHTHVTWKDESMTETKQWMGLHNHDRHFYSPGYGDRCGKCWYCSPETPCYCCLQAEVEALRARNETLIATIQRQDSTFERQMEEHEELEALRAQVQRVREACVSSHVDDKGKRVVFLDRIQRALDGAE